MDSFPFLPSCLSVLLPHAVLNFAFLYLGRCAMGAYLSAPVTTKKSEDGTGNGMRYGVSAMQGWRVNMEVRNTVLLRKQSCFARCSRVDG